MDINRVINQLEHQERAIFSLTEDVSENNARWKPDAESWSILEVLNHLVDEEILDFRRHLEHILYSPQAPWPKIDPEGWVTQKAYNQRSLSESRENFRTEREASIAWLLKHTSLDMNAAVDLEWGSFTAGDLIASWLAHDLLHIRQLVELHYLLTANNSQPYNIIYAGKW